MTDPDGAKDSWPRLVLTVAVVGIVFPGLMLGRSVVIENSPIRPAIMGSLRGAVVLLVGVVIVIALSRTRIARRLSRRGRRQRWSGESGQPDT